jgi:hypothetical protein
MNPQTRKVKVRISLSAAVRDALDDEKARTGAELSEIVNGRLEASYSQEFDAVVEAQQRRPILRFRQTSDRG